MTEKGKNKKAILVLILLVILRAAIGLVEYTLFVKHRKTDNSFYT